MTKPKYEWIPEPLGRSRSLFPNGERWCLYQTNHPKGYPHYLGKVCKWPKGLYSFGNNYENNTGSMRECANKLLASLKIV